eukprot:CAMPEP_0181046988 /NCGR_PEP_ID=MMETSP1070-20121207/14637_1 /TAXON_ID=265543 /ORGANISM="Minutocellus polymorphus, Strain NH13" /LENGTH=371 /DNA_ID=CAMNT_0023125625 /DNA_START=76 /DNA_END=1191 /DNA_ORIENTATION=-
MVHCKQDVEEVLLSASSSLASVSIIATKQAIEITTGDSFSTEALSREDSDLVGDDEHDLDEQEEWAREQLRQLRAKTKQQQQDFPALVSAKERKKVDRLAEECPGATRAELRRFLAEHKTVASASKKLRAYFTWRNKIQEAVGAVKCEMSTCEMSTNVESQTSTLDDRATSIWEVCCRATAHLVSPNIAQELRLPQIIRLVEDQKQQPMRDVEGNRVLLLLPAMLDTKVASVSTYALATMLYIDAVLDRSSMETPTLVLDVRPGRGWSNPTPQKVVPYLQKISQIGANMFPERLNRAVAVPVPAMAVGLWNMAKPLLDKKHASKVSLVSGPANGRAPLPTDDMLKYFSSELIEAMEESRRSSFVVLKKETK